MERYKYIRVICIETDACVHMVDVENYSKERLEQLINKLLSRYNPEHYNVTITTYSEFKNNQPCTQSTK